MTGYMINIILNEFKIAHLGSMAKSGTYDLHRCSLSENNDYVNL